MKHRTMSRSHPLSSRSPRHPARGPSSGPAAPARRSVLPAELMENTRRGGIASRVVAVVTLCLVILATIAFSGAFPEAKGFLDKAVYTLVKGDAPEAPRLSASIVEGRLVLVWTEVRASGLSGYKVVASATNPRPRFPEDGSLLWLPVGERTWAAVDGTIAYEGGDIGDGFVPGRVYFFAVTALYEDGSLMTSEPVEAVYPDPNAKDPPTKTADPTDKPTKEPGPEPTDKPTTGPEPTDKPTTAPEPTKKPTVAPEPTKKPTVPPEGNVAPQLVGVVKEGGVKLSWTSVAGGTLQGYKVVVSKGDSTPRYPENGYLFWITDKTATSVWIDNTSPYHSGDFGDYMTAGESYYFAITAVYSDGKATSNVVRLTCPVGGPVDEEPAAPVVSAQIVDGAVKVRWTPIADARLAGYKVVASRSDEHPVYPEAGYAFWITDPSRDSAVIAAGTAYSGGDVGGAFEEGVSYWFSVTAVYEISGKWVSVAGNAIAVVVPGVS